MSKHQILSRYERSPDGKFLIDVSAANIEQLYNNFDRHAPYMHRDLAQDLVDYLIICAREMAAEPFAIRFLLNDMGDAQKLERVKQSVKRFFDYLAGTERDAVKVMLRKSAILGLSGFVILILSIITNEQFADEKSIMVNVFAEGFTIAAWVALWEALATLMLEWPPHRKDILLFHRLSEAELHFELLSSHGGS